MNKFVSLMLAALPLILTSCATPPPPQVFYNTDSSALVIKSVDNQTSQMLYPSTTTQGQTDQVLTLAQSLPQRQTAVVMLENYAELEMGKQFRDRTTPLFVALRGLNYEHIVFLQGKGVADPNGLITLAEYY